MNIEYYSVYLYSICSLYFVLIMETYKLLDM